MPKQKSRDPDHPLEVITSQSELKVIRIKNLYEIDSVGRVGLLHFCSVVLEAKSQLDWQCSTPAGA